MTGVQIHRVIAKITYKDWKLKVLPENSGFYLQVQFMGPCAVTGKREKLAGRKWILSAFMTKSELVTTAFKAVLTAEEHECREHFKYKGQTVFGPHLDVDALAELAGAGILDVRAPMPKTQTKYDNTEKPNENSRSNY